MKRFKLFFWFALTIITNTVFCQSDTIKAKYMNYDDIRVYVQKNVKYPSYAIKNNIDGTVLFKFKVTKSGKGGTKLSSINEMRNPNDPNIFIKTNP